MIRAGFALVLLLLASGSGFAQESPEALFARGLALYRGEGVARDLPAAAAAFEQAARQDHAEAAHRLGLMHGRGEGIAQDDVLAYVWLARAAAAMPPGEARTIAVTNRSTVAERLTPEQIERLQAMSRPARTEPAPPAAGGGWKGLPAAVTPDPGGGFRVQLGAFREEERAQRALAAAQRQHADLLKGLDMAIRSADRGAFGRFYRVQAGPLDAAAADRICDALRARTAACLVVVR